MAAGSPFLHVTHNDEYAAAVVWKLLKEVASDNIGRQVDVPWHGASGLWN